MKRVHRQKRARALASLAISLLCWGLFSILALFIIWGWRDRAALIRDNDNERILNALFTSLRDYDDPGAAITENETLRQSIAGFAIYDNGGLMLQQWGKAPQNFDSGLIAGQTPNVFNRYTIPDRQSGSVRFVIHNERLRRMSGRRQEENEMNEGPGRHGESQNQRNGERRFEGAWFNLLARGNYVYIDIRHSAYWRTMTLTGFLRPLVILCLLALALGVRRLYLRNAEYRERIEAQQNLVVLGTAASTLAHEIKNPLLSIKLQTGILKKILDPSGRAGRRAAGSGLDAPAVLPADTDVSFDAAASGLEETLRIDEEVDRLSALTYRVHDYLRDAKGNPEVLDAAAILEETSRRLCGVSILEKTALERPFVFMDGGRARSVFENVLTNALEAGGPDEGRGASVWVENNTVVINVYDRGRGLGEAGPERVFDPFFTTKSSGTGIGLAVSRRFVEAAGGTISLENREGGGAMARIRLPFAGDSPVPKNRRHDARPHR